MLSVLLHGAFYAEYLSQNFRPYFFSSPGCMLCKIIAGEQSLLNRKHFLTSHDLRMRHNIRQGDRLTKKRRDLLWLVEPVFPWTCSMEIRNKQEHIPSIFST